MPAAIRITGPCRTLIYCPKEGNILHYTIEGRKTHREQSPSTRSDPIQLEWRRQTPSRRRMAKRLSTNVLIAPRPTDPQVSSRR